MTGCRRYEPELSGRNRSLRLEEIAKNPRVAHPAQGTLGKGGEAWRATLVTATPESPPPLPLLRDRP